GFRKTGRPAYLFGETLGGTVEGFLTTAFDEVWLQPSGEVFLTGFAAESPFLKRMLENIGVEPLFSARKEYKSAPEMFTDTRLSGPSRESLQALLDSWAGQVIDAIATRRKLPPQRVRELMDKAPLLAGEAKDAGLVDHLGYADQMNEAVEARFDGIRKITLEHYRDALEPLPATSRRLAVIQGHGTIHRGKGHFSPVTANAAMGSDTMVKAFEEAIRDDTVAAIVFRVDSPGGDYTASDTIWHEVKRARAKGKPVIAYMGEMAASGGYFVSMAADGIVAQPGTITGSIGVFSGKFVLRGLWEKIDVAWDGVHVGANATLSSANHGFTPKQRERFEAVLDEIYTDFTSKAAKDRKLSAERIDAAARGRVFSGADALKVGLVDTLGGFATAVDQAKKVAGIPAEEPLRLVSYPRPKPLGEALLEVLSTGEVPDLGVLRLPMTGEDGLSRWLPLLRKVGALVEPGRGDVRSDALRMPPLEVYGKSGNGGRLLP
ncbi:MAG: signal peptide peptidase SppA, partial [Alphaproteobacteria bacterium]